MLVTQKTKQNMDIEAYIFALAAGNAPIGCTGWEGKSFDYLHSYSYGGPSTAFSATTTQWHIQILYLGKWDHLYQFSTLYWQNYWGKVLVSESVQSQIVTPLVCRTICHKFELVLFLWWYTVYAEQWREMFNICLTLKGLSDTTQCELCSPLGSALS